MKEGDDVLGIVKKTVDCVRNGAVITSYRLSYGFTKEAVPPDLAKEAERHLIADGWLSPAPFDTAEIRYVIRDGWDE